MHQRRACSAARLGRVAKVFEPKDFRILVESDPQLLWLGVGACGLVAGVRPRFLLEKPIGQLLHDAWVGHWVRELHAMVVEVVSLWLSCADMWTWCILDSLRAL